MSSRRTPATLDLIAALDEVATTIIHLRREASSDLEGLHVQLCALEENVLPRIQSALRAGADADVPYGGDRTHPIIFAANNRLVKILQVLLRAGASPHVVDRRGFTALAAVCTGFHTGELQQQAARMLLEVGADPNLSVKSGGIEAPLLVHAAAWESVALVRLLVDRGAAPSAESGLGETALLKIASYGTPWFSNRYEELFEFVDFMLSRMPYGRAAKEANNAFVASVSRGNLPLAKYLKERYGARIDPIFPYAYAPIHAVAECYVWHGQSAGGPMLAQLLEWGADIEARDANDRTLLHLACARGLSELVRRLVELGADLDARCGDSQRSVVDIGRQAKQYEVLPLLRAARAKWLLKHAAGKAQARPAPQTAARQGSAHGRAKKSSRALSG